MKTTPSAFIVCTFAYCSLIVMLACCSDENGDSFSSRCKKVCSVQSTSPCAGKEGECNSTCISLANQASSNADYMDGCAECIINSFHYSISPNPPCGPTATDPACCWGIQHASPTDDTCLSQCVEPDGGMAY